MSADIVSLDLKPPNALKMIKRLAANSDNIIVVNHARERQNQRGITRRQLELCLQKGVITEGPFRNQHGNWQVNMYRNSAGEEVTCTVAIEWERKLIVITVF